MTGPDGKFVIQERSTWTFLPFLTVIKGPQFYIFKPGYGRWVFRGSKDWPKDAYEREILLKKAWEQFTGEGVTIELPPLKTREERKKQVLHAEPTGEIPAAKMPRYLEAIDRERIFLGFQPLRRVE